MLTTIKTASHKNKRDYSNSFRDNSISCSPCWNQLWGDCQSCNCKKNLNKVIENTSDQVGLAIKDMQRSLSSLACMVTDHHLALDFLLAKQGGVCAIANTSCYTYINTSGIVEKRADYILQQAKWLWEQSLKTQVSTQVWEQIKSWLPSRTWFLHFLGPIGAIILLLVFGLCNFKLTCQVSFFSPRIHQTTNASGGDANDLLLESLWQTLSWSALMLRAPSSPPVSRKQLLNRLCCPYL
jgi:hypothetical protein